MAFEKLQQQTMHISDFIQRYDAAPFEWIDGERIELVPGIARHIETIRAIFLVLHAYTQEHQLGEVYTEAPFVIEERTDWVKGSRVPDVLFYKAERFAAYTSQTRDWRDKPFALVPDLAIEVVSPNDRYTDINNKVNTYLSDGVQMVWIIDPQQRNAMVHRTGQTHIIQANDTIDGADILPGLQVRLNTLLGQE